MENKNLMLIDDSPETVRLMELFLGGEGYKVSAYTDLESAFEAYNSGNSCDVLVTDYHLDGETGKDVLDKFRGKTPDMKVIVMTGRSDLEWAELGFDDIWEKPMDLSTIHSKLSALTNNKQNYLH